MKCADFAIALCLTNLIAIIRQSYGSALTAHTNCDYFDMKLSFVSSIAVFITSNNLNAFRLKAKGIRKFAYYSYVCFLSFLNVSFGANRHVIEEHLYFSVLFIYNEE